MNVWTEVKAFLPSTPDDWSRWIVIFEDRGLIGTVQTDDPPTLSAYVPPGEEGGLPILEKHLLAAGAIRVETRRVAEEDWAESWKQFFKPRRIGHRLVVKPTWEEYETVPGDILLVLDPGQAFGTGDHPTTRGCLEILESLDVMNKEVADIGCGSGILSVAAVKLGAKLVMAVDLDQPSVTSTVENAARNHVVVNVFKGKGFEPLPSEATFDIVVSNIISAAIISLAPDASLRVRPEGFWVVSGIISANWPDVMDAAKRAGFKMVRNQVEGEWVAAIFQR